jgi:hypothetical protein
VADLAFGFENRQDKSGDRVAIRADHPVWRTSLKQLKLLPCPQYLRRA